jgi:lincosamide and streptogramin A transport system ATP-binding/permease protein
VEKLAVLYDGKKVVENVGFSIDSGDRAALIGKNGSGKSSILKLLNGGDIAFEGSLRIGSGLVIYYISQEHPFYEAI